jgi:hypothetical protein
MLLLLLLVHHGQLMGHCRCVPAVLVFPGRICGHCGRRGPVGGKQKRLCGSHAKVRNRLWLWLLLWVKPPTGGWLQMREFIIEISRNSLIGLVPNSHPKQNVK